MQKERFFQSKTSCNAFAAFYASVLSFLLVLVIVLVRRCASECRNLVSTSVSVLNTVSMLTSVVVLISASLLAFVSVPASAETARSTEDLSAAEKMLSQGFLDEILETPAQAALNEKKSFIGQFSRGRALLLLNEPFAARNAFAEATTLAQKENNSKAQSEVAIYLALSDGASDRASQLFQNYEKQSPDLLAMRVLKSQIYMQEGRCGKAALALKQVLKDDSKNFSAAALLSLLYLQTNAIDSALHETAELAKNFPMSAFALSLQAQAEAANRNYPAAINTIDRALLIARSSKRYLSLRSAYLRSSNSQLSLAEILAPLNKLILATPKDATAYSARAEAILGMDDFASARCDFENSIKYSPDDPYKKIRLAKLLLDQHGNVETSRELVSQALKQMKFSAIPLCMQAELAIAAFTPEQAFGWISQAKTIARNSVAPYILEANAFVAQKQYDGALRSCKLGLALDSQNPELAIIAASLATNSKDRRAAIAQLNSIIELGFVSPELLASRARLLIKENEVDAAQADITRALLADPWLAQERVLKLHLLSEQERNNLLPAFSKAIAKRPSCSRLYFADIISKSYSKDSDKLMLKYCNCTPDFMRAASLYRFFKDPEKTIAIDRAAEKLDPHDDRVLYQLSEDLLLTHQNDAASALIRKAYELAPNRPEVLCGLARDFERKGDSKSAEETFKRAFLFDADSENTLNSYVSYCSRQGDAAEGYARIEQALRRCPRNVDLNDMLYWCPSVLVSKQLVLALRLLEMRPYEIGPYNMVFDCYKKLGQLEKAKEILAQQEKCFPNDAATLFHEGQIANLQGNYSLAVSKFSLPVTVPNLKSKALAERAYAFYKSGRLKDCIADLNIYIAGVNSESSELRRIYQTRGKVYQEMKNYSLALADFTSAIQRSKFPAADYARRAEVYLLMNEQRKAMDDLDKALRYNSRFAKAHQLRSKILKLQGKNVESAKEENMAKQFGYKAKPKSIEQVPIDND